MFGSNLKYDDNDNPLVLLATPASQVSSASLDDIKFEKGPAKPRLTRQKDSKIGAGTFTCCLHLFNNARESSKVVLSIIPWTIDTLPNDIRHYNALETFPVLSYPMINRDGQKMRAELFPPAEPGKKSGLHGLGVVNTMALPVATDNLDITINSRQFVTCIRYRP